MLDIEIEVAPPAGFAAEIAEADIPLPNGFVADIDVSSMTPGSPCRLRMEALVIEA